MQLSSVATNVWAAPIATCAPNTTLRRRAIPLKKGSFANQLGNPDYIFVCMDTVSHPLVISAQKEARKHGAQLVKLRRGSASALERELIRVTTRA